MKMYLNTEQTTHLMELGFDKPRYYSADKYTIIHTGFEIINYTIGDLIEILPQTINVFYDLSIMSNHKGWCVLYGIIGDGDMWSIEHEVYRNDLIDALYDMIIRLKEEGVI